MIHYVSPAHTYAQYGFVDQLEIESYEWTVLSKSPMDCLIKISWK